MQGNQNKVNGMKVTCSAYDLYRYCCRSASVTNLISPHKVLYLRVHNHKYFLWNELITNYCAIWLTLKLWIFAVYVYYIMGFGCLLQERFIQWINFEKTIKTKCSWLWNNRLILDQFGVKIKFELQISSWNFKQHIAQNYLY